MKARTGTVRGGIARYFCAIAACFVLLLCSAGIFGGCEAGKDREDPLDGKELYSLKEAYEGGVISREALMSIAYYHNGGREYNEAIMGKDYQPIEKVPAQLSEQEEDNIKAVFAQAETENKGEVTRAEDIVLVCYYGVYDGCYAFIADNALFVHPAVDVDETDRIGDVNIHYTDFERIMIWDPQA